MSQTHLASLPYVWILKKRYEDLDVRDLRPLGGIMAEKIKLEDGVGIKSIIL
jgi:hypothetical protein